MDISKVDYWATSGKSMVHRATVLSKLIATAFVIACVVLSHEPAQLACMYAVVLVTVRAAKLPLKSIVLIALFPSLFALLFAVSYAEGGWRMPVVVMLKALTASTSMVLLISTTPYAEVAGYAGRILPRVLADGLFMTYRSFFILLQLLDNFIDALRLRGGFRPRRMFVSAGNLGSGIGMMFIRSFEKSQKLYDVMSVRGYSGRLSTPVRYKGFKTADLPYMTVTAVYFALLVYSLWKMHPAGTIITVLPLAVYVIIMEAAQSWKT